MGQIDVGGSTWIRCSPKVQSGFTCDAHLLCSCVDRGREEEEVIRTTVARRKEGRGEGGEETDGGRGKNGWRKEREEKEFMTSWTRRKEGRWGGGGEEIDRGRNYIPCGKKEGGRKLTKK